MNERQQYFIYASVRYQSSDGGTGNIILSSDALVSVASYQIYESDLS